MPLPFGNALGYDVAGVRSGGAVPSPRRFQSATQRQHGSEVESEFDHIQWIRERGNEDPLVVAGLGDDCAVIDPPHGGHLLVTTDALFESVHFVSGTPPRLVGRKALAVSLSDVAAMAGTPTEAVVSVGFPSDYPQRHARELHEGIEQLAAAFDVRIVGGDTNASRSGLVVSITLLGRTNPPGAVWRSGARPGDAILVTGTLGGSVLGKHLKFTPRVREALALHQRCELHAMIDISDGLAADLHHILRESGCGAVLRQRAIPISEAAGQLHGDRTPLDHALSDGEDFELLFTVSPQDATRLLDHQDFGVPITQIGEIVAGDALLLQDEEGRQVPLRPHGYDHFRS